MKQFFEGFPKDLEEAATMDGASRLRFDSGLAQPDYGPAPLKWTTRARAVRAGSGPVVAQAFADIAALSASTSDGTLVLTGIPNFVTVFGCDSLISSWFLLDAAPQVAAATLRHLGAHQGRVFDTFRQEEPGKIPHEVRLGELSRMNDVPFARYYGTTDATMLYVIVLAELVARTGDTALARELEPRWRAAVNWIRAALGPDGLVRYPAARDGKGLTHTCWKDSDDSESYGDGRLATGQIAVVEIQGYTIAALRAAADDPAATIDRLFWNDRLGLHVNAVDADGRQCDTATSNPGHLLWSGVLTGARARQVADRMLQADLWTGWGLRTLSATEAPYKPLSFHNGSVWPHDTAIFAAGLLRYGLATQSAQVTHALTDHAAQQPGFQLPELCGGHARGSGIPPLVHVETCRPQARAAAAMVWVALQAA